MTDQGSAERGVSISFAAKKFLSLLYTVRGEPLQSIHRRGTTDHQVVLAYISHRSLLKIEVVFSLTRGRGKII